MALWVMKIVIGKFFKIFWFFDFEAPGCIKYFSNVFNLEPQSRVYRAGADPFDHNLSQSSTFRCHIVMMKIKAWLHFAYAWQNNRQPLLIANTAEQFTWFTILTVAGVTAFRTTPLEFQYPAACQVSSQATSFVAWALPWVRGSCPKMFGFLGGRIPINLWND